MCYLRLFWILSLEDSDEPWYIYIYCLRAAAVVLLELAPPLAAIEDACCSCETAALSLSNEPPAVRFFVSCGLLEEASPNSLFLRSRTVLDCCQGGLFALLATAPCLNCDFFDPIDFSSSFVALLLLFRMICRLVIRSTSSTSWLSFITDDCMPQGVDIPMAVLAAWCSIVCVLKAFLVIAGGPPPPSTNFPPPEAALFN